MIDAYTIQENGAEGLQPGDAPVYGRGVSGAWGLECYDLLGLETCAVKDLLVCLPESGAKGSQPEDIPGSQQGVPPGSENSKIKLPDAQSCMLRMC